MPRNQKIEEILEAWYEWFHGETFGRAQAKKRLYDLLDAARAGTPHTAEEILDALWDHFLEYRASRYSREKLRGARLLRPE